MPKNLITNNGTTPSETFFAAERSVVGDIHTSSTLWPTIQALCDDYNGRFVGSADERGAANYISKTLARHGLSNVHLETFPINGWRRGPAVLTAAGKTFECIGLPGTPPCDIDAPIINVANGESPDFEQVRKTAKGKLALIHGTGSHRLEKYTRAVIAGCAGFIFGGTELGCLPPTGSLEFGGAPAPIPGVGVSHETLLRLCRLAENGPVYGNLQIKARKYPTKGYNVIADIPSGEPPPSTRQPPPLLMLCAHYDGHDIAQGAVDNASGTTAVIEAARALMQVKDQLNIGVRVALWSGEETGMHGSAAYTNTHKQTLAQIKFVFNCDIVSNSGSLWMTINGADTDRTADCLRGLGAHMVHNLQVDGNSVIVPYSDHFSFYMKGVPALMLATPHGKHNGMGPHTSGDTLDKVDVQSLRTSTAYIARAILHLAHNPTLLPAHHATRAELQTVLRTAGFEQLLRAQGRWRF